MPTLLDLVGVETESVTPTDGRTLVPLLEGRSEPDRHIFSELHAECVHTTCVMVRQGDLKYIHTTGHPAQLYDLANGPGEWINLAGDPACVEDEHRLADLVAANFDLDAIERDVMASLQRRQTIKAAKDATGLPHWDYQPSTDATRQYWRKS